MRRSTRGVFLLSQCSPRKQSIRRGPITYAKILNAAVKFVCFAAFSIGCFFFNLAYEANAFIVPSMMGNTRSLRGRRGEVVFTMGYEIYIISSRPGSYHKYPSKVSIFCCFFLFPLYIYFILFYFFH